MAEVTYPGFKIGTFDAALEWDVQMSMRRDGRVLTYGLPGARWLFTMSFEAELEQHNRPAIEAWLVRLKGGANRAKLHHFGRPMPRGTLRGSPILGANAAAGSETIQLANCNGTLKAGDLIGVGGQIVMIDADISPVSSAMTAVIRPGLRTAVSIGAAVTWDKPTTLFIPRTSTSGPFPYLQAGLRPGFSVQFVEAW